MAPVANCFALKGGDDTFGTFPAHLRALISHALPNIEVLSIVYPRFETRGDLKDCVARFREWLQNKVIDLEVSNKTPSPTIDPAVHTILIGHSMGGIVAAETLLLLANEQPIRTTSSASKSAPNNTLNSTTATSQPNQSDEPATSFMFPHIQGILAFDTPYLGLAPGMIAHGLEGGHKAATNAYNAYNEMTSIFGWGSSSQSTASSAIGPGAKTAGALPAPAVDAAAAPTWQSWGKYAMFAGAAGAVVAGGAAALYSQRDKISAGWGWATSHLLFVGDLARAEILRKRVETGEQVCRDRGLGWVNLYTNLGKGAREGYGITSSVAGNERTFCNLPQKARTGNDRDQIGLKWFKAINEKAKDETSAHCSMFLPRDNPGYYRLGERAKEIIVEWVDDGWYATSQKKAGNPGMVLEEGETNWADEEFQNPTGSSRTKKDDYDSTSSNDWEGLDKTQDLAGEEDYGVQMTDGDEEHDLQDSVIVEKAAHGEIPLPKD